jgi:hypothetical protein
MYAKDSVEQVKCLKRKISHETFECKGAGSQGSHTVTVSACEIRDIIELWHEIESLSFNDCERYWDCQWKMCQECWECGGCNTQGVSLPAPLPRPTPALDKTFLSGSGFQKYLKCLGVRWDPESSGEKIYGWHGDVVGERRGRWYAPAGCDLAPINDLGFVPRKVVTRLLGAAAAPKPQIAARACADCTADISSKPKWHARCASCCHDASVVAEKKRKALKAASDSISPEQKRQKIKTSASSGSRCDESATRTCSETGCNCELSEWQLRTNKTRCAACVQRRNTTALHCLAAGIPVPRVGY